MKNEGSQASDPCGQYAGCVYLIKGWLQILPPLPPPGAPETPERAAKVSRQRKKKRGKATTTIRSAPELQLRRVSTGQFTRRPSTTGGGTTIGGSRHRLCRQEVCYPPLLVLRCRGRGPRIGTVSQARAGTRCGGRNVSSLTSIPHAGGPPRMQHRRGRYGVIPRDNRHR